MYNVIYADPPWDQKTGRPLSGGYKKVGSKQVFNPISNQSSSLPYKTMSVREICNLPVKSIASDDCQLFIWVTNKYLMRVNEVIKAWGFKYSTTLVWVKKPMGGGLGGTFKICTEFLIFGTRGKVNAEDTIMQNWFQVKRQYENGKPVNSKKPDFFRNLIEQVSTKKRIELFARKEYEGWDTWGNEVNNSVKL